MVLKVAAGGLPDVRIFGQDYNTPDGTCIRDFIHVRDLASAHLLALEATGEAEPSFEVYNLGSAAGFSVREVIEAARKVTGRAIPARVVRRRSGDPPRLVASSRRARRDLGWQPREASLEQMLADAWAWKLSHPTGYAKRKPRAPRHQGRSGNATGASTADGRQADPEGDGAPADGERRVRSGWPSRSAARLCLGASQSAAPAAQRRTPRRSPAARPRSRIQLAPSATADVGHQLLADLLHRPADPAGEVVVVRRPAGDVGVDVAVLLQPAGEPASLRASRVRNTVARPSRRWRGRIRSQSSWAVTWLGRADRAAATASRWLVTRWPARRRRRAVAASQLWLQAGAHQRDHGHARQRRADDPARALVAMGLGQQLGRADVEEEPGEGGQQGAEQLVGDHEERGDRCAEDRGQADQEHPAQGGRPGDAAGEQQADDPDPVAEAVDDDHQPHDEPELGAGRKAAAMATPSRRLWIDIATAPIRPMCWCAASSWSSSVAVSWPRWRTVIFSMT